MPLSNLLKSAAGTCPFCHQRAGILSREHPFMPPGPPGRLAGNGTARRPSRRVPHHSAGSKHIHLDEDHACQEQSHMPDTRSATRTITTGCGA